MNHNCNLCYYHFFFKALIKQVLIESSAKNIALSPQ